MTFTADVGLVRTTRFVAFPLAFTRRAFRTGGANGVVDVTAWVNVGAVINDRNPREGAGAGVDATGAVSGSQLGRPHWIVTLSVCRYCQNLRLAVEFDELLWGDLAGVEGGQAVLDAGVVVVRRRGAGPCAAIDVDFVIL